VEVFAAKRQAEAGEADEDRILRGRHWERLLGGRETKKIWGEACLLSRVVQVRLARWVVRDNLEAW
jgi:hypothetical protein